MLRWLKRGAFALLILIVIAFGAGWWLLHGSLATLDGNITMAGLSAPVDIERDQLGVVTIKAANELDAMRALGYLHAQERFFEMDLMRRSAAGELSELFGPVALETDEKHRIHRFRARALDNLDTIAGEKLPQLQAYTDGINAGLHDLKVRPWPYLLLGMKPEPWQLSDTPLVGYAMYFELQGGTNERELALWRIRQHVPAALWALISRDGTSWDAPLEGEPRGDAVLPDAATLDLRKLPMPDAERAKTLAETMSAGSNNFAVAGALTKDGRAIVADDMHLGLRVPDIWFRARLIYPDAKAMGGKVDMGGFTLPGIPTVIVGSNTHVAWGFTNSYGDWMNWMHDCDDAQGIPCFIDRRWEQSFEEKILVKGDPPFVLRVDQRHWGTRMPDVTGANTELSLTWAAHFPGALTLGSMDMALTQDVDAAVKVANHAGIPAQNMLVTDSDGHIGWTIAGRIPAVLPPGCDRTASAGWASPLPPIHIPPTYESTPFDSSPVTHSRQRTNTSALSSLAPDRQTIPDSTQASEPTASPPQCEYVNQVRADNMLPANMEWLEQNPSILNPPSNRLWSANNRVTDGTDLAIIGDDGYTNGARAKQIRDDLFARKTFTEKDLLAIQLDDRALFLTRWHALLEDTAARMHEPRMSALAGTAKRWDGRADPASVSYRIVRAWRLQVLSRIRDGLLAPAEAALGDKFIMPDLPQLEGVAWPMVTQRPANLLSRRYSECVSRAKTRTSLCGLSTGWDALFADAAGEVQTELAEHGPLVEQRWGKRNTAAICHPLARALPSLFKRWLCMPPDELPGDAYMPRVATPDFGASERMVVSPGHEADGIIEMPGGQSGNPLSPFWGAGHEAWVRGEPTPFLPGATTHTLRLVPAH